MSESENRKGGTGRIRDRRDQPHRRETPSEADRGADREGGGNQSVH